MKEKFNNNNNIPTEEIYFPEEKLDEALKKRQDSFLDTYYDYMQHTDSLHKSILKRKVIELELIDPSFNFEIE